MTIPDQLVPYAADYVVSAAQLAARGIDSHEVRRLVGAGVLHRLCTGWYATRRPDGDTDRHLLRSRAVLRHLDGRAALSHQSRVLAAGLLVWPTDLRAVHVTRVRGTVTRRRPHVISHSQVPDLHITSQSGLGPVVPVAVACAGPQPHSVAATAAMSQSARPASPT